MAINERSMDAAEVTLIVVREMQRDPSGAMQEYFRLTGRAEVKFGSAEQERQYTIPIKLYSDFAGQAFTSGVRFKLEPGRGYAPNVDGSDGCHHFGHPVF